MRLLCLSNGHGEDGIGRRILEALRSAVPNCDLSALPLVGEGKSYAALGIPCLGPCQPLPSGGFNQAALQFIRDLRGGMLGQSVQQWQALQQWCRETPAGGGLILAVGDILPLAIARVSGWPYAFVGTAKSDYYWRDDQGPLPLRFALDPYHRCKGTYYEPWEVALMRHPDCRMVFPRDSLTSEGLRQLGVRVVDAGNPMMDGLACQDLAPWQQQLPPGALVLLLLPGSRWPEAQQNWGRCLAGLQAVLDQQRSQTVALAAIAPELPLKPLLKGLASWGWLEADSSETLKRFQQGSHQLWLGQQHFVPFAHLSVGAIALAGTATEQVVGLGKPVVTLPGRGPQFTRRFAQLQARLLGPSLSCVDTPEDVPPALMTLLQADRLTHIRANGMHRLGPTGAAGRIAEHLQSLLLPTVYSDTSLPDPPRASQP
jgi:uncharacterized protein (TIGR03492 family)